MCTASCCGVAFAAGPDAIRWPGSDHSDALAARDEVRSVPVFCRSVVITSLALAPLVLVLSAVRHRPGSGGGAFGPVLLPGCHDGPEDAGGLVGERDGDEALVLVFEETAGPSRSEEHTSELQSLMRHSYAVF